MVLKVEAVPEVDQEEVVEEALVVSLEEVSKVARKSWSNLSAVLREFTSCKTNKMLS